MTSSSMRRRKKSERVSQALALWRREATLSRVEQFREKPTEYFRDLCSLKQDSGLGTAWALIEAHAEEKLNESFSEWSATAQETKRVREIILEGYIRRGGAYPIAELPQDAGNQAYLIYRQTLAQNGEALALAVTKLFLEKSKNSGITHKGFSLTDGELQLDHSYHEKRRRAVELREQKLSWEKISKALSAEGFQKVSVSTLKRFIREERMLLK